MVQRFKHSSQNTADIIESLAKEVMKKSFPPCTIQSKIAESLFVRFTGLGYSGEIK